MRPILKIVPLLLLPFFSKAQNFSKKYVDSLYQQLGIAKNDSARYFIQHRIYSYYEEKQKDSALSIAKQMLELAKKNQQRYSEIISMGMIGYQQMGLGNYSSSLTILLPALELSEDSSQKSNNTWSIEAGTIGTSYPKKVERQIIESQINHLLGNLLFNTGNIEQSEKFFRKARKIAIEVGYIFRWGMASMNLGRCFLIQNKLDSALILEKQADSIAHISASSKYLANINTYLGDIAVLKKQNKEAFNYYKNAIQYGLQYENYNGLVQAYYAISKYFLLQKQPDSSLFYSNACLQRINSLGKSFSLIYVNKGNVYQNIYDSYLLTNKKDSINKYRLVSLELKDSINKVRINTLIDFQNTLFKNQLRLQSIEKEKINSDNRNRTNLFIAGIILVAAVSILLFHNNRIKQKDNVTLQKAFSDLKSTQSQLIQSEKMASLGELTAGIAHEIQNPLNFVNNFSELNVELIAELRVKNEELGIKNEDINDLVSDIQSNSEKINHHGQRAASIVKGMLQHSRTSSGQKEPTDINALCDEYLRLAYHGLRAKDKSFNAEFKTEFDPNLPQVNIVPQDMGRVVLNLINNAFFAVKQRQDIGTSDRQDVRSSERQNGDDNPTIRRSDEEYTPMVSVSTRKKEGTIIITVSDNGTGIPNEIREKIFQPFFTTKPTGQGTGLGLSLSYDIVKAHGGELRVESEQGKGTTFKIEIPI
jgi:signal transduction histidine kinase